MKRRALYCALAVLSAAGGRSAVAQDGEPSMEMLMQKIREMNDRIEKLEAEHAKVREADQKKIATLENQVEDLRKQTIEGQRAQEIEEIKSRLDELSRPSGPFDLNYAGTGGGNLLNPELTVFVDMGGSLSSRGENEALNRFNLREVELDLRAAISPSADGVLILALGEEIEQERNGDVEINREVDIEEGYVHFHTLPYDFSLKAGKFRPGFGRNNQLHTHDLPQVTRPLAIQNFFGPEGLSSLGASLSWLVPNPWNQYVELTVEVVNADGGEESPILGGPNAENPAVIGHLKFFKDVGDTSSFELGGSYLYTHSSGDPEFDANIFGLDATYQWTDPDPSKFRSLIVQGEVFWAQNDVDRGFFASARNDSFGAYVFAQYQFQRDWYAGLRFDYSEFPNSESRGTDDWDFAISPYVSWYISEFLRLRAEYQHRIFEEYGDTSSEEAVFLQLTFVFGAHPPHPYWVHR